MADSHSPTGSQPFLTFRWRYVVLPCLALFLSLALAVYFYGLLPAEVGYSFIDGAADKFAGRGLVIALLIVPNLVLAGVSLVLVKGTVVMGRRSRGADTGLIGGVMLIMGNMIALPQFVLILAMLDIFLANVYQVRLAFLAIAIALMAIGLIILVLSFILVIRRSLAGKRAAGGIIKERANV